MRGERYGRATSSFTSTIPSRIFGRMFRLPPPLTRDVRVDADVPVPMDDGVTLLADVFTPALDGDIPTVLVRSPYGRKSFLGIMYGRCLAERGFRSVVQSCRGTFGSGGEFRVLADEHDDGLATLRWVEAQPWFDGRLAMVGPSYLGYVQWAVAADAGPSLRALCPQITTADLAAHWYHGGSLSLDDAIGWTTMVATQESGRFRLLQMITHRPARALARRINHLPVIELDEQMLGHRDERWRSIVEHTEDTSFWQPTDHAGRVAEVTAPVQMVTGWHDLFLPHQLAEYSSLVKAGNPPHLTIGPWTHVDGALAACGLRESLSWLGAHVRGDPGLLRALPVRLRVMGSHEWRDFAAWPPEGYEPQRWHLHAGGRLAPAEPGKSEPSRYTYDPADPTPVTGGTMLERGEGGRKDQRSTEARDDVLCFTSDVLEHDVEIVGEVEADIRVECDIDHFDVFVRLCEVDERDRSLNVCDGILRVSGSQPARQDDGVRTVRVPLWPTAQRFRAGRCVRVQVSSGAHPRFIRNLGTGEPIATGTTMRRARVALHHSPEHPSAVVLPIRCADAQAG